MGLFDKMFGKAAAEPKMAEKLVIGSPLKGRVLSLSEVKDEVFSTGVLGQGIAIDPVEGKAVAPVDAEVASLFPTKHAIGLLTSEGAEILIHIGLDTVELDGKYFEAHVAQGDKVKKGQTLVTFDLEKIKESGYVTEVPVLLTGMGKFASVEEMAEGTIEFGDTLMVLA